MENESGKVFAPLNPGAEKLQSFFMEHLNRLYCAKAHVVERLPDIVDAGCFKSIKITINEAIERAETQVNKMDQMYSLFNAKYSFDNVNGLVNFLEKSFTNFQWNMGDPDMGVIMILSYLSFIECLEAASVHILKLLAVKLQNEKLSFLLKDSFVQVDRILASQLTNMYTETAQY
jgi:ferritin-like metal-binding protein YciE